MSSPAPELVVKDRPKPGKIAATFIVKSNPKSATVPPPAVAKKAAKKASPKKDQDSSKGVKRAKQSKLTKSTSEEKIEYATVDGDQGMTFHVQSTGKKVTTEMSRQDLEAAGKTSLLLDFYEAHLRLISPE